MKTIKLIDLLVKVANDEDVPKNIEYSNIGYHWTGASYYNTCLDTYLEKDICLEDLNYPVKIIEEKPKKIEELDFVRIDDYTISGLVKSLNELIIEYNEKINEIIKTQNDLIERIEFDD